MKLTVVYTHKAATAIIKAWNNSIILPHDPLQSLSSSAPSPDLPFVIRDQLPFLDFYIDGIIQYVLFFVWLILYSKIILRFIHVVAYISISFFILLSSIPLYGYAMLLLAHLLTRGWQACSQFSNTVNKFAMNICVDVFFFYFGGVNIQEWNC